MTLGTIIAIVLGIVVLALLIFGFSTGWNNMWNKVTNYGAGENNVNVISQTCSLACSSKSEYDFCTLERKLSNGTKDVLGSCNNLSPKYVDKCPGITCASKVASAQTADIQTPNGPV